MGSMSIKSHFHYWLHCLKSFAAESSSLSKTSCIPSDVHALHLARLRSSGGRFRAAGLLSTVHWQKDSVAKNLHLSGFLLEAAGNQARKDKSLWRSAHPSISPWNAHSSSLASALLRWGCGTVWHRAVAHKVWRQAPRCQLSRRKKLGLALEAPGTTVFQQEKALMTSGQALSKGQSLRFLPKSLSSEDWHSWRTTASLSWRATQSLGCLGSEALCSLASSLCARHSD